MDCGMLGNDSGIHPLGPINGFSCENWVDLNC
jgi:hypothetical protein